LKSLVEPLLHTAASFRESKPSPNREALPNTTSNGYRNAKRTYYAVAIGAAAAGALEIVDGQIAVGLLTELVMGGFVDAATTMRRLERTEQVVQGLLALGQRVRNSQEP